VVRKAICSAYFSNAAKFKGIGEYVNCRTVSGAVCLHCATRPFAAFGRGPFAACVYIMQQSARASGARQQQGSERSCWLGVGGSRHRYISATLQTFKGVCKRSCWQLGARQWQDGELGFGGRM
jgi:hypothetical protein